MAVIDYEAVKASVSEVSKAGKESPQKEMFFAVSQDMRTAKIISFCGNSLSAL